MDLKKFKLENLVYATGSKIYLYVDGINDQLLAERDEHVWSLCFHKNILYDATPYAIFNTLTGEKFIPEGHSLEMNDWIISLYSYNDSFLWGGFKGIRNVFAREKKNYKNLLGKEESNKEMIECITLHNGVLYSGTYGRVFETISGKIVAQRHPSYSFIDLCSHSGTLYDAWQGAWRGDEGNVSGIYETFSGKLIAARDSEPYTLVSWNGRLFDGGGYKKIFDTFTNKILVETSDTVTAMCTVSQDFMNSNSIETFKQNFRLKSEEEQERIVEELFELDNLDPKISEWLVKECHSIIKKVSFCSIKK